MKKVMKKFFAIVLAGILLGAVTGVTFYGVTTVANYADPVGKLLVNLGIANKDKVENVLEQKDDTQSVPALQGSKPQMVTTVTDISDIAAEVMPALVSIVNEYTATQNFGYFGSYEQQQQASGSGIIVGKNDTELLLVTNYHVVEGADKLVITFVDNTTAEATVKGNAKTMDLAVIAVSLDALSNETKSAISIAKLGDSDSLQVGEPAIAIGNALGYGQSVTTGVISALNRTLEVSETGASNALIQTDAAINPGNSGGALLNINGEVIGINSSKIGDSLVEGMGYAIPISSAKPIIENLMNRETRVKVGEEERGYLGISCINVTAEISATYDMPEGIFVAQVYEGTGADRAGLVRGDIITEFDGTAVSSQAEMTALMQYYKAGDTVEITIMQGSASGYQAKKVELTLSSLEEMNAAAEAQQEPQQPSGRSGYYRFP